MFKCPTCKKRVVSIKTSLEKEYQDKIVKIINVPAKHCPACGEIFIEESDERQITDFLTFGCHENIIDYSLYEAAEVALITNMFNI